MYLHDCFNFNKKTIINRSVKSIFWLTGDMRWLTAGTRSTWSTYSDMHLNQTPPMTSRGGRGQTMTLATLAWLTSLTLAVGRAVTIWLTALIVWSLVTCHKTTNRSSTPSLIACGKVTPVMLDYYSWTVIDLLIDRLIDWHSVNF